MALPQSRRLDFSEVPVIDIGPLVEGKNPIGTIDALSRACSDVGFLYVRNHRVPQHLIPRLAEQAAWGEPPSKSKSKPKPTKKRAVKRGTKA